jgi:hypothetical protein
LGAYQFVNKTQTAKEMSRILFSYTSYDMKVFFKNVFRNMTDFWERCKPEKFLEEMAV